MPAEPPTEIRDLTQADVEQAIGVIGRGMRDNPLHMAAYGADPDRRLKCHTAVAEGLFRIFDQQEPICAVRDGVVLGVAGTTPPGTCQPRMGQRLRMLPALGRLGPRTTTSMMGWLAAWAKHDPKVAHVHLGPVAVDAHIQGQGIGSMLMREHCRRLDRGRVRGYLETDKRVNVDFYARFGYEVIGQADVLGVMNWFMLRMPA